MSPRAFLLKLCLLYQSRYRDTHSILASVWYVVRRLVGHFRHPAPALPAEVTIADPAFAAYAREIVALLRPMDAIGFNLVRKGRPYDGGYVMLNAGLECAPVYSIGISDDVSWDSDMAALGCDVFQYDHTVPFLPAQNPKFHFARIGLGVADTTDGVFRSLASMLASNGHSDRHDVILKMDIENAEWDVLESASDTILNQFSQIIIELHELTCRENSQRMAQITRVLRRLASIHQPVHVHANNFGRLFYAGGVALPECVEVAYVRRAEHRFAPCAHRLPCALDMPCNPAAADYPLDGFSAAA